MFKYGKLALLLALTLFLQACGGGGGASSSDEPHVVASAPTNPTLLVGTVSRNGSTLTFPLTLTNAAGTTITSISTDIHYNPDVCDLILDNGGKVDSAVAGAAVTAANKQIFQSNPSIGILRVVTTDLSGKMAIPNGVLAQASFTLKNGAAQSSATFSNTPTATDANGNEVAISGF